MYDECSDTDKKLLAWKEGIEDDFKRWVNELTEIPEVNVPHDVPDIYSFYQELCVFRNEIRKGGRRNQDVLSRFGENLSGFKKAMEDIQGRLCRMDDSQSGRETEANRSIFVPLVGLLERMGRLSDRLKSPPKSTFSNSWKERFIRFVERLLLSSPDDLKNWETAWSRFKDGFEITHSHLDGLLKKEGITRIETVGMPFDPSQMSAVAVEYTDKHEEYLVIEEITAGFLLNNIVLKLAEVKISRIKGSR
ncbi:MAG: nucleotide exchange factor GrpE [Planctomycetes bacterium]|nr:nucleotide exchange factor GrpE [Planctomycetota bacterium]